MPEAEPGTADRRDPRPRDGAPGFWFARLFSRLRLPFWLGAVLLVVPVYGVLIPLDWYIFGPVSIYDVLYLPLLLLFFEFIAFFLGREAERILAYAESLGAGGTEQMRRTLYDTRWSLLVALPIEALAVAMLSLTSGFTLPGFFHEDIVHLPHVLFGGVGIWAFVQSMRSLSALGRAPLSLKPFAEDRSLGLNAFGRGAFRLVAIYELAVLVGSLHAVVTADYTPAGVPLYGFLASLGVVFFFLSLLNFRRRLQAAKAGELRWIGPRYAALVRSVQDAGGSFVDDRVARSLSALDKIHEDVQQIQTWPFDHVIATRLASITVLPLVITVLAREVMILALHV